MPIYHRAFERGQLQFITSSTYRRAPVFARPVLCKVFVEVLDDLRHEFGFLLIGWVLMADHFHLLLQPRSAETTSRIIQQLKQRTAYRILQILQKGQRDAECRKMLARFRLPDTVHDQAHYRVWQRRFYVMNVFSETKRLEKLNYMHANPVKRGLCSSPDQWPWSSFRFYFVEDTSVLRMDRLD